MVISRTSGDLNDQDDEPDYSLGSSSEEMEGFTYDQEDPMDNIIDYKMIKEYLEGKVASEEGGAIEYGKNLDVVKYISEKEFIINSGTFSHDYVLDALDN